jgi:aspartyl aminopeptidase
MCLVPSSTCYNYNIDNVQVGSDSMQGAGAPTMFHAMRRIVDSLMHQSMGEGALERAITSSFLGMIRAYMVCWI